MECRRGSNHYRAANRNSINYLAQSSRAHVVLACGPPSAAYNTKAERLQSWPRVEEPWQAVAAEKQAKSFRDFTNGPMVA
jgi:hypothetical protein